MAFWDSKEPAAGHLRLYEAGSGWRAYESLIDTDQKVVSVGARQAIEMQLNTSMNASNLVLLTGAGSSFCAVTSGGKPPPSMAALWDSVEAAATPEKMAEVIASIPTAASAVKNIEKLLTLCKLYVTLFGEEQSQKISAFIETAEKTILDRVDFVSDATDLDSHRMLIRKIARRSARKPRAKLFTTNYDLCFEYAARGQRFVVVDGFSHSVPQTYDRAHFIYDIVRRDGEVDSPNYIENVFHLYKLHGSVDWRRSGATILRSRDPTTGEPVLIYPRDSKYQEAFESPYLDMMGAFQTALREPDTAMLVSGFGFNDDHISKPVMAALEANTTLRLIVSDVAFLKDQTLENASHIVPDDTGKRTLENQYLKRLKTLVELGDQRIVLMNGRFADLANALPDLVAQTERERHLDRMQRLQNAYSERGGRDRA